MTYEKYQKYESEFKNFSAVENKTSNRPDVHAFNLLDKLFPTNGNMVADALSGRVYLDVPASELGAIATESQIVELIQIGRAHV